MKNKTNFVNNDRIYTLDLFRFIAAISVVLYHYLFRGWTADNLSDLSFVKVGSIFKYGYLGVDFFFMISGFVIAFSIKNKSISKFIISRFTRLYPVYWLSVTLTFIVVVLFGGPRFIANFFQYILNLTMFQNYMDVISIDGVYWTLFVEMKFYIFVIGSYLIFNKIKKITLDHLIIVWTFFSVLYLFFENFILFKILNVFLIFNYASLFIAGIIFCQVYRKGLSLKYCSLLSITFLLSLYHSIHKGELLVLHYNNSFSPLLIGGTILVFYLILLMVSTNRFKTINFPFFTNLGMLTYPLYLIHQNIGYILMNNLSGYLNKYVLIFFVIVIMIFISWVISKFYEPLVSSYLRKQLSKKNIL